MKYSTRYIYLVFPAALLGACGKANSIPAPVSDAPAPNYISIASMNIANVDCAERVGALFEKSKIKYFLHGGLGVDAIAVPQESAHKAWTLPGEHRAEFACLTLWELEKISAKAGK